MTKILAALVASVVSFGAFAQASAPMGAGTGAAPMDKPAAMPMDKSMDKSGAMSKDHAMDKKHMDKKHMDKKHSDGKSMDKKHMDGKSMDKSMDKAATKPAS